MSQYATMYHIAKARHLISKAEGIANTILGGEYDYYKCIKFFACKQKLHFSFLSYQRLIESYIELPGILLYVAIQIILLISK